MTIPTNPFISKLKSDIATLSSDKLNLEEQNANLQYQNGILQEEVASLQHKWQVITQLGGNSEGSAINYEKVVALEDDFQQKFMEFQEKVVDAHNKVREAKKIASELEQKLESEQKYSADLHRQVVDIRATEKALRAQKAQAEKKAKDANAIALEQTKEMHKAQKQKREWEAKYKRAVISSDVDAGKPTNFKLATPKAQTKTPPKSASTFGKKTAAANQPAFSKASSKHPGDPPSKLQPPSKGISRLRIGSSANAPFVLDEDEDDMPLAQRSKRKAGYTQQNEEDQDDEELIPIRIKRERIE
ncbi:hypothetical protein HII31_12089 [Pseudocercospora fuligena]|uniref:Uncharacterized protein n=1 Tax=Pseudocercospora fuligena TaxID=685502 RepID=A0A8H6RAL0_9PEZI|nr:hypothetical protein HII31_12089 [Pseudocercospora fuligena]